MMVITRKLFPIIAIGLITWSCERASEEDINPDNPLGPNLPSLQANIFDLNCALSGCHAGSSPTQGLNLEAGQTFTNIVNVSSNQMPGLLRVRPGDPDQSYLYLKVTADPSIVGSGMPLGRPQLSEDQLEAIRLWISNGAPEN